jgi:regulator of protease activity HflC (stomatin/prohibitin superfamily)
MLVAKYLLCITGFALLLGAAGILVYDLYRILKKPEEGRRQPRWKESAQVALIGVVPLLLGLSLAVVPGGYAGVSISQVSGAQPAALYPGVHWIVPLVEHVQLFETRDRVYSTTIPDDPKKKPDALRVQTREGLSVGLAVTVRFRLEPAKLPYIYNNVPQPVDQEVVAPVVASAFREAAPNYMVREVFANRREAIVRAVAGEIARRLAADGITVKQVMLRDIQLPAEYARGLEGLLLKEQENERLSIGLEVKQKMVKAAELEAEAQKAREVKEAEAQAQVTVLQAKAQADAMQYTLPLKQKQIEQTRLEAEARAQAKLIDSKAELERRKLVTLGEADRIRAVAAADAERLKLEADVLKQSPLLIRRSSPRSFPTRCRS